MLVQIRGSNPNPNPSPSPNPNPNQVQWERGTDGLLPGPFLTPISMTHAPPTSVLAPMQTIEVGDYVRGDWAARGVLYPGEVGPRPNSNPDPDPDPNPNP